MDPFLRASPLFSYFQRNAFRQYSKSGKVGHFCVDFPLVFESVFFQILMQFLKIAIFVLFVKI